MPHQQAEDTSKSKAYKQLRRSIKDDTHASK